MRSYEELLDLAYLLGLRVNERYSFDIAPELKALIVNNKIKLSKALRNDSERREKLAEEIAHALTNNGNITDLRDINNARQEKKAHKLAVHLTIELSDIVEAVIDLKENATLYNVAEYLNITEEFLKEALEIFRRANGNEIDMGSYIVRFNPFNVREKYK